MMSRGKVVAVNKAQQTGRNPGSERSQKLGAPPYLSVGNYARGTGGLTKPTKDLTLPMLQRKDSQLLHLLRMSGVMVINADLESFLHPCLHLLHVMDLVGVAKGGHLRKMTLSKADFLLKVRQLFTGEVQRG